MTAIDSIAGALAPLSDDDLARLRSAADASPGVVPGLLAYIDHVGDWEQHRRRGVDFPLQPPANALGDDERGSALMALAVLADEFRESGHDALVALFDAIAGAVTRDDEDTMH